MRIPTLHRARQRAHHAVATVSVLALMGLPAVDLGDLLDGLFGGGGATDHPTTAAQWRALGSTSAADRPLRGGCRAYPFRYAVRPPDGTDRWMLELFLRGPHGGKVASQILVDGGDPRRGRSSFQVCRQNTTYGRFTIRGRLILEDWPDEHSGWIRTSHFRLTRPS